VSSVPVLTLAAGLPFRLVDELLSEVETVLERHGARRLWIEAAGHALTVVAELPADDQALPSSVHLDASTLG
jgi:hypothetical protein